MNYGPSPQVWKQKKTIKIFAISVYLPCTRSKNHKEREEEFCSLLDDLKKLVQEVCIDEIKYCYGKVWPYGGATIYLVRAPS